jgi:hypothetical protein
LIDIKIENAVSRMQMVIELGRVLRDRRTLPIKVRSCFNIPRLHGQLLIVFLQIIRSILCRK